MVHLSSKKKLLRPNDHRRSMVTNLAKSLILHDKVDTTLTKAKVLKSVADRFVTISRGKDKNHAERLLFSRLGDENVVKKLFLISNKLSSRNSGFTSHVILRNRPGDNSIVARVAWVDKMELKEKVVKKETKKEEKISKTKDSKEKAEKK